MTTPDEKTLATLTKLFEEEFGPIGDRQVLYVHAPGRSEISGNHTDHEGGHVIAGSLDVAVDGIAVATDSNKVRVADEGSTSPSPAPSPRAAAFPALPPSRPRTVVPWKPSGAHPPSSPSRSLR